VIAAAKIAEAHDFVIQLPKAMDGVGARSEISGGQRQLRSHARFEEPPILILDEATSAVDNETEAAIQRSLENYY